MSFDEANIPSYLRRYIGSEAGSAPLWTSGLLLEVVCNSGKCLRSHLTYSLLLAPCIWFLLGLQSYTSHRELTDVFYPTVTYALNSVLPNAESDLSSVPELHLIWATTEEQFDLLLQEPLLFTSLILNSIFQTLP